MTRRPAAARLAATILLVGVSVSAQGTDPTMRLIERLRQFAATLAVGHAPVGDPEVGRLSQGAFQEFTFAADAGVCYRILAVGGDGVFDIDLAVYRGTTRVAQDTAVGDVPIARWCPLEAGPAQVRVIMYRGQGAFSYQAFRGSAEPAAAAAAKAGPRIAPGDDYLARRLRALHAEVGQGRRATTEMERGRLRTSESRAHSVQMDDGRCYTVIAVGVPSVRDLDLTLHDAAGSQVAEDETHEASVRVTFCTMVPGTYRAQVRMFAGYGAYALQAFVE